MEVFIISVIQINKRTIVHWFIIIKLTIYCQAQVQSPKVQKSKSKGLGVTL